MSHQQHRVGGQLAFGAFEIGQPAVVKAVTEEGVHVAVHQVADERLWRAVRFKSPQTVVWRFARPQIGHREDRITDSDALAPPDDLIRKRSSGRPFVPKHGPENLLLRVVVTANHLINTGHGVHGHISPIEQGGDPPVMVGMTVGDDDCGERFPERLDARAERPPIRDTERRVDDNNTGSGLDEIGVDWKETGLESVNGDLCVLRS